MIVHIDVETYSETDLGLGAYHYFRHPSTELLCVCYQIGEMVDGKFVCRQKGSWVDGDPTPYPLGEAIDSGAEVWAHNCEFEAEAINNLTDWCEIKVENMFCTVALAACYGLPLSLEKLGKALNIEMKKDTVGGRLMKRLCKPGKDGVRPVPTEDELKALVEYCERDVDAEIECGDNMPGFTDYQLQAYRETVRINRRGIHIDRPLIAACQKGREQLVKDAHETVKGIGMSGVDDIMSPLKLMTWLKKRGLIIPNAQKGTLEEMLEKDIDADCRTAIEQRLIVSNASLKKFDAMDGASSHDGRVRGAFQFHAALTGRWGGRLLQPQNLPRPTIKGDLDEVRTKVLADGKGSIDELKSLIRHSIRAPEGKEFICADWSNIEGRMLAWLAGEEWKLEAFREYDNGTGPDLYKLAYARSFGVPVEDVDDSQRAIGKVQELALGYAGGAGAIEQFAPCKFTEDEKEDMKTSYRKANSKIQKFWYNLEQAAKLAIENVGKVYSVGVIKYKMIGAFLYCKLPSGRKIVYPNAHIDKGQITYMKYDKGQWLSTRTYSGKLAENCYCRDTQVLTIDGLKPIEAITPSDLLWDGEEWVNSDGVINQGKQEVGKWLGVTVTGRHMMLGGDGWKEVMDLDEQSTISSLKLARDSVISQSEKYFETASKSLELGVNALAATNFRSNLVHSAEEKLSALLAAINVGALVGGIYTGLQLMNSVTDGDIDIQVSSEDVTTATVRSIKTMGLEELKSTIDGAKTAKYFSRMCDRCTITPKQVSTLTELIMKEIMRRVISDLSQDGKIVITGEARNSSVWAVLNSLLQSSGESMFQSGVVTTLFFGTSLKVDREMKLWKSTNQKEEVFDIKNCGPRNRFTILTDRGFVVTHNCTQAACACLMMAALSRFDNIVMTVHDEIVCEVPEGSVDLKEFENKFSIVPEWAEGLPVSSEGWIGKEYRK